MSSGRRVSSFKCSSFSRGTSLTRRRYHAWTGHESETASTIRLSDWNSNGSRESAIVAWSASRSLNMTENDARRPQLRCQRRP